MRLSAAVRGGMAERLMALVLKTSDAERHRGFESLSLRHFMQLPCQMEKYPSGRRGSPAKGVVRVNRSESSNLSFSAEESSGISRVPELFSLFPPKLHPNCALQRFDEPLHLVSTVLHHGFCHMAIFIHGESSS